MDYAESDWLSEPNLPGSVTLYIVNVFFFLLYRVGLFFIIILFIVKLRSNVKLTDFKQQNCVVITHYAWKISFVSKQLNVFF